MLCLGHVIAKFAFGGNKARANRDTIQYLVPIDFCRRRTEDRPRS